MEDPDRGASASDMGAREAFAAEDRTQGAVVGRLAAPPTGGPPERPASDDKHPRKRRKRKRGRKVFARDGVLPAAPAGAPPIVVPVSARAVRVPEAPTSSALPIILPHAPAPRPARKPSPHDLPVYAALDLGTNNCRLLVAIPSRPGQFRVIDAFSRIVRLGEGLTATGRLGEAAMERAIEALKVCADKLGAREIRRARLIATEACRTAENGAEFIARVRKETGLSLEVIDRRTEARLAVSGCGSLVEDGTEGVVLFDIGGGSSEIALIGISGKRHPSLSTHIRSWTSLPVGVVSLAERFGGMTVTRDSFATMTDEVTAMLAAFEGRHRLAHLANSPRFHLLGTSGTVTTLAGIHLGLERYDRRRVDGLWMNQAQVDAMVEKLLGWDFAQRVANPCIGPDRADLVMAGCAILEAIRRVWPSDRLRVADRGLREGILSELMAEDGAWRRRRGPRPS